MTFNIKVTDIFQNHTRDLSYLRKCICARALQLLFFVSQVFWVWQLNGTTTVQLSVLPRHYPVFGAADCRDILHEYKLVQTRSKPPRCCTTKSYMSEQSARSQMLFWNAISYSEKVCRYNLPQTLLVIWTLFQPVSSNLAWMYSSNLSPLSSTCHCLRDLSQLPSSMLLSNLCSKTQFTSRWTLQLSSYLKSEFYFKGFGTYHSCSYIITFGIILINYSLPVCISAVLFHWNCPSSYPKWSSSCNQLTKSFSLGTSRSVCSFWYDWS